MQKPSIICVISKNNWRPEVLNDGDCIYKTNGPEVKAEVSSEEKGSGIVGLSGRVDEINQEEQVEIETRTEFWKMTAFVESVKEPEKGWWRNRGRTRAGVSRDKDQSRRSVLKEEVAILLCAIQDSGSWGAEGQLLGINMCTGQRDLSRHRFRRGGRSWRLPAGWWTHGEEWRLHRGNGSLRDLGGLEDERTLGLREAKPNNGRRLECVFRLS